MAYKYNIYLLFLQNARYEFFIIHRKRAARVFGRNKVGICFKRVFSIQNFRKSPIASVSRNE